MRKQSFLLTILATLAACCMGNRALATAPDDIVTDETETSRVEHFEIPRRPLEESDLARISLPSGSLNATKDHPAVIFTTAVGTSDSTVCNTYPVILTSSGDGWTISDSEKTTGPWYWSGIWTAMNRAQIWASLQFHCESSNGQVLLLHSPDGGRSWQHFSTVGLWHYLYDHYNGLRLTPDGNVTVISTWERDGWGPPCIADPEKKIDGTHGECEGVAMQTSTDEGKTWKCTGAFHGSYHWLQTTTPAVRHPFMDYEYLDLSALKQRFPPKPNSLTSNRLPGAESIAFDEALLSRATAFNRYNRPFLEIPDATHPEILSPYLIDPGRQDGQEGQFIRLPYRGHRWAVVGNSVGILEDPATDANDLWVVQCINPERAWTAGRLTDLPQPPYAFDSLVELENGALELHVRLLPDGRNSDELGRVIFSSTDEGRSWTRSRFEPDILVPLPGLEYPEITTPEEADKQLLRIMEEAISDVKAGSSGF